MVNQQGIWATLRQIGRRVHKVLEEISFLWGWVPGGVAAVMMGYFTVAGDLPLWQMYAWSLLTLCAVVTALRLATPGWSRTILLVLLGVVSSFVMVWGLHKQANENEQKLNDFHLEYAGPATDTITSPVIKGQPIELRAIKLAMTFDNKNNFDIYTKSIRRSFSIEHTVSGDPQETVEGRAPAFFDDYRLGDTEITLSKAVKIIRPVEGTVDFYVCYGREKGKYTKHFTYKGSFVFTPRGDGRLYAPDFYPAQNDKDAFDNGEGCKQ